MIDSKQWSHLPCCSSPQHGCQAHARTLSISPLGDGSLCRGRDVLIQWLLTVHDCSLICRDGLVQRKIVQADLDIAISRICSCTISGAGSCLALSGRNLHSVKSQWEIPTPPCDHSVAVVA